MRKNKIVSKKSLVSTLTTLTLLCSSAVPAFATSDAVSFESAAMPTGTSTVTSAAVTEYMESLVDIGSRLMGTESEYEASDYIESVMLESYAADNVSVQEVVLTEARKTTVAAVTVSDDSADGSTVYYGNLYGYVDASDFSLNDSSLLIDFDGTIDESVDYLGKFPIIAYSEVQALTAASTDADPTDNKTVEALTEALKDSGAIGLMVYNDVPNSYDLIGRMIFRDEFNPTIPVLGFDGVAGEVFIEANAKGDALMIESYERGNSENVIAVKKATDDPENPDAIIHITGHFDSVMGAPGASDNASGAVGVMALAEMFADADTGGVELRFAALGGEEGGLNGSVSYVATLTQAEKDISINMNMDMIATDEAFVDTVSLDIYGGVFNLPAALIISTAAASDFELLDDTNNVRYFNYGGSDHVNFQRNGMNASSMILAIDEDDMTENEYHLPSDNMEQNYSLDRHMQAISLMAGGIANAVAYDLSLDAELSYSNGTVTIGNTEELKALFPMIEIELISITGAPSTVITLDTASENSFTMPEGQYNVTVMGKGYGNANLLGTYDRAKVEPYSEILSQFYTDGNIATGDIASTDTVFLRGELIALLSDLADADLDAYTTNKFSDVPADHEYAQAIAWASENKIVNGVSDTEFAPNMYVTQEQVAQILLNYSNAMGITVPSNTDEVAFADTANISDWAMTAVKTMQTAGLISVDGYNAKATIMEDSANAMLSDFVNLIS